MIGGDTLTFSTDCYGCFIDHTEDLAGFDRSEWSKLEDVSEHQTLYGLGSQDEADYLQKHNPFVYFNPIRLDQKRCKEHVVSSNNLNPILMQI